MTVASRASTAVRVLQAVHARLLCARARGVCGYKRHGPVPRRAVQAQEREQREAEGARREAREKAAKSEGQLEDEELEKQRKWDEWKDEHPTGYGNSKLRPCAL